jgi:hypothetical protein
MRGLVNVYSICAVAAFCRSAAHVRRDVRDDVLPHVHAAKGETRFEDIALREPNWPVQATKFGYAFANQFELPVLFYVLTILEIITKHADLLFVILAWIFVVMRILQAGVHVTNNNVRVRGGFYGVGAIVLLIMWIIYIVRILLALP